MTVDFDKVLERIGEFGRYQIIRFIMYNIIVAGLFQYTLYNLIFISYTPRFWCATYNDGGNVEKVNATHGFESSRLDILRIRWLTSGLQKESCSIKVNQSSGEHEYDCGSWVYDHSEYEETLVTQWNLVCDDAWWVTIIQTMSNVCVAIGALIFATIMDMFGRKIALLISITVCVIPGTALAFSPNPIVFTVLRSIQALMVISGWCVPYISCIELVGPSKRTFVTAVMVAVFALGATSVALVAWLCTHWFTLALVTTVPFCVFYLFWPFFDESPRWLLIKGRTKELKQVCEKIAAANGVPLKRGEIDMLLDTTKAELKVSDGDADGGGSSGQATIFDLFRTHPICIKTLMIVSLYVANALVYTGLAFNVDNLEGNRFFIFGVLMLMEVPAGIAVIFILDRFGRIIPMAICMVFGGIAAIVVSQIPVLMQYVILAMAAVCKLGISTSFAVLCQLASETFPTPLRGSGAGLGGFLGNLSTVAIPFIVASAKAMKSLPMVVMGLVSVIGGIVVLFLPETFNTPLPETIADCNERRAGVVTFWKNITLKALRDARRRGAHSKVELQDLQKLKPTSDFTELAALTEKA